MLVHNYSNTTGEFLSSSDAQANPREPGEFIVPANATLATLPTLNANEALVYNNGWQIVADYREQTYYKIADGEEVTFDLGEEPDVTVQATFPQAVIDALHAQALQDEADAAAQEVINIEAQRVSDIKNLTKEKIISLIPDASLENYLEKEMNLLMANAALDDIVITGGTLSAQEAAAKAAFRVLKDNIQILRTMSGDAEINNDTIKQYTTALTGAGY